MLSSAKNQTPPSELRLDLIFRALADQTRLALLTRLAEKPANVTELAQPFAMSLPAVSRHIRVLESAGLVRRAIDGRVHHCSLNADPLRNIDAWLGRYRSFWEGTLDSLARHLDSDSEKNA